MLAAVGMSLGFDSRAWRILRDLKGWVVLVPLMIIVGTFLGGVAAWTMLDMSFRDVMAVAAGFGYYSLSSMLINQLADVSLGSMALISNMVRELVTLLFAPLFARAFGGLGPLSAAGAASDTRHYPYIGRAEHHPWDLLGHGAHHRRPHLRDIHFRMAVTQSNKKRNQPVDASERLAYLYANPTISFHNLNTVREHHAPIHLQTPFDLFLLRALHGVARASRGAEKRDASSRARNRAVHPACRCPAGQSRPRRRDRKRRP